MTQQFINLIRKHVYTLSFVGLLLLLVITRLYKLPTSLEFFADIGRDHWVLWKTVDSKKPPLLGPSLSAFAFHQSPIYYYLNLPVFVLSGGSAYSTVITILLWYILLLIIAWQITKDHPKLQQFVLFFAALILIHPEFVSQMRYPWNPSFAPPVMLLSVVVVALLRKQVQQRWLWLYSLTAAVALGLSYSNLPLYFVLTLYLFWQMRKKGSAIFQFLLSLIASGLIVFGPLLAFEWRHDFLLFRTLLSWKGSTVIEAQTFSEKFLELTRYVLGIKRWGVPSYMSSLKYFLGGISILSFGLLISREKRIKTEYFFSSASLGGLLILYLLFPFSIFSHYVFGVTVIFFWWLSTLPQKIKLLTMAMLVFVWLQPWQIMKYLEPARRTIAQQEQCAQQACQQLSEPLAVTVTAWHRFHHAPDWQFFFAKHGCQVVDPTMEATEYSYLAVVADQSNFELGKSEFDELTRFGAATEEKVVSCEGNIQVHVLRKN